jgi:hypothetical protein
MRTYGREATAASKYSSSVYDHPETTVPIYDFVGQFESTGWDSQAKKSSK